MKKEIYHDLPFQQLMTTPFRAETGVPKSQLPVYSAINPPVPPYLPYRRSSYYPHYSSYRQLKNVLPPKNIQFTRGE